MDLFKITKELSFNKNELVITAHRRILFSTSFLEGVILVFRDKLLQFPTFHISVGEYTHINTVFWYLFTNGIFDNECKEFSTYHKRLPSMEKCQKFKYKTRYLWKCTKANSLFQWGKCDSWHIDLMGHNGVFTYYEKSSRRT